MTSHERLIRLHLEGSRTHTGAIDFDALLAFGEHLRRALRASLANVPAPIPSWSASDRCR